MDPGFSQNPGFLRCGHRVLKMCVYCRTLVELWSNFGRISQQILGLQIDYECGLKCKKFSPIKGPDPGSIEIRGKIHPGSGSASLLGSFLNKYGSGSGSVLVLKGLVLMLYRY
jgi:hypothetical protein